MEGREAVGAPESVERKMESHGEIAFSSSSSSAAAGVASVSGAVALVATPASMGFMGVMKKKGRPRKYSPDGSLVAPLSLMPISSSPGEFTVTHGEPVRRGRGRGRGRARPSWSKMFLNPEMDILRDLPVFSGRGNFVPHIIRIGAGEDITTRIMTFSQQGLRAVCILSANGVISNVTLRQPDSSGGTLTYEGLFELLSLTGSFMPTESGEIRSRSGGISVSLACPDGRVIGGGLAGLLVAACPMQAVIASFMPHSQVEQTTKRPRPESPSTGAPTMVAPITSIDQDQTCSGGVVHQSSGGTPHPGFVTSVLRGDHWASLHSASHSRNTTDINVPLHTG